MENQNKEQINLTLRQRIEYKIFGITYIEHRRYSGWSGALPFYAFRCDKHGLVVDYRHGYKGILECPRCRNERR